MLTEFCSNIFYTFTLLSLLVIDYILGNGFVDALKKIICKAVCFIRKSAEKDLIEVAGSDVNLFVLLFETVVLGLTIMFLNKYKRYLCKDKFDNLLQESRETLRRTNEILEKWRLRRLYCQVSNENPYLDEEPQEVKAYKIEVPILRHIAIIDTLGTSRNQLERGDGLDSLNYTDSTFLSMTSLLEELQSVPEVPSDLKFNEFF